MGDAPNYQRTTFECVDYNDVHLPAMSVVYCDPPYRNTKGYNGETFDSEAFWEWARRTSLQGHSVIVSEISAPADFECISEFVKKNTIAGGHCQTDRIERLFRYVCPYVPHVKLKLKEELMVNLDGGARLVRVSNGSCFLFQSGFKLHVTAPCL